MRILPIVLMALSSSCCPCPKTPEQPVEELSGCDLASRHLTELAKKNPQDPVCARLQRTPAGKPFLQFCRETLLDGVPLNTSCMRTAATCQAMDQCPSR